MRRFNVINYRGAELWDSGELVLDVRVEKRPEGGKTPYAVMTGMASDNTDIHSFHATISEALAAMTVMLIAARRGEETR